MQILVGSDANKTLTAGSFYGFSTILLPYGLPPDKLNSLLAKTSADHVIAEAGTLDLDSLHAANKALTNVIWVTKTGSEHMAWSDDAPSGFIVNSWHDLVEKNKRTATSEVLPLDRDSQVPPVSIFCPGAHGTYDLVKYTSEVSYLMCHKRPMCSAHTHTHTYMTPESYLGNCRTSSYTRASLQVDTVRYRSSNRKPHRQLHSLLGLCGTLLQRLGGLEFGGRRFCRPAQRHGEEPAYRGDRCSWHHPEVPVESWHEPPLWSVQVGIYEKPSSGKHALRSQRTPAPVKIEGLIHPTICFITHQDTSVFVDAAHLTYASAHSNWICVDRAIRGRSHCADQHSRLSRQGQAGLRRGPNEFG